MDPDVVNTARFIEIILGIVDEVVFPAIALYIAYLIRKWLKGELEVPPYEHKVTLQEPVGAPLQAQSRLSQPGTG